MSDPRRWIESDAATPEASFERSLLQAGIDDAMSDEARRRLVRQVVAATGATVGIVAATATGSVKGFGSKLLASALLKWLAAAALLGAVVAVVAARPATAPPSAAVSGAPTVSAPRAPPPPAEPAAVPTDAVPTATAAAASSAEPTPRPVASTRPAEAASHADTAGAEAVILDEARAALRDGDPNGAILVLDQHRRAYDRPALADEAFVLRAEALSAKGDHATVRTIVEPWLATHPASPYASRLRRVLARAPSSPEAGR